MVAPIAPGLTTPTVRVLATCGVCYTVAVNLYTRLLAEPDNRPFLTDPVSHTTLSYQDVADRSAQLSAALRAHAPQIGDRVVVQVDKCPDAVALYLACLRSGLIYVPVNTAYTATEIEFFVSDISAAVFVCDPGREDELSAAAGSATVLTMGTDGSGTLLDQSDGIAPFDAVVERDDQDVACVVYTSGTTGRSKGAMLSHASILANSETLHAYWGYVEGDVLLHNLPIFHVHGLFVALNTAMINRSEVIFAPRFDVELVLANLPRASVMMGVPTHYIRLLADDRFTPELCSGMRLFTSGSAPMTAPVMEEFAARSGHRLVERYGMSETLILTSNPLDGERVAGTVGFALPGCALRIGNEQGVEQAPGAEGEVQVRPPQPFLGYWDLPDKTAESFTPDGWFRTGDVGTADESGRVTLAGRASDMIISGGYNVYPKEIELVLDDVDGVGESAVVGVPHPDFGEGVVAVVTTETSLDAEAEAALFAQLDEACRSSLARFKNPKHYVVVPELPRNAMAKIQKKQLREQFADLFS